MGIAVTVCVFTVSTSALSAKEPPVVAETSVPVNEQGLGESVRKERDIILSLLAYAAAYSDWQPMEVPREQRRGYNIAAILADPEGVPVGWARNTVTADEDSTRHAELKVIVEYLEASRHFDLKGFTVYSTLEPCAMCSGMMVMTSMSRVVFGQSDVDFGGALGRLSINSTSIGGYRPYPRTVIADPTVVDARTKLDEAYKRYRATSKEKMIAKFLTTPEAKAVFRLATERLSSFKVKHAENDGVLAAGLKLLEMMNSVSPTPP